MQAASDVSVTLPTRSRARHIVEAVECILACTGTTFELLSPLCGDARLRYPRTETRWVCAKHARLRDPWGRDLFGAYLKLWGRMALYNLFHTGIGAVSALISGALSSFRFEVDPATPLYRSRK